MTSSIATIPVNSAGNNVLPQTNRIFESNWSSGFPLYVPKELDGLPVRNQQGQQQYSLSWNFKNANDFRFGKYYAELELDYNDGTSTKDVYAEVSFWVIPWFLLLIGLVVFILVGLGVFTLIRSMTRRFRGTRGKHRKYRS